MIREAPEEEKDHVFRMSGATWKRFQALQARLLREGTGILGAEVQRSKLTVSDVVDLALQAAEEKISRRRKR